MRLAFPAVPSFLVVLHMSQGLGSFANSVSYPDPLMHPFLCVLAESTLLTTTKHLS